MSDGKDLLAATLQAISPIAEEDLAAYLDRWHLKLFAKGQPITVPGQVQRELFFVVEGYQKSYYLAGEKQHVMAFTYRGNFSGIPDSYLRQRPSWYHLEALTDSLMLSIPYEDDIAAITTSHSLERAIRILTEEMLIGLIDRYKELQSLTIEQRFRSFVERSGPLLNALPHKDIASYLRIDPSNFSRLLNSVRT